MLPQNNQISLPSVVEEIKRTVLRIFPDTEITPESFEETADEIRFPKDYMEDFQVQYLKRTGIYVVTFKLGITFSESDRGLTSAFLKVLLKIMNFFDAQVMNYTKLYTRACGLGV
jgi:hypothetical protein